MLQRLRPGGLDELGFIAAMQELVDSWRERHPNIEVEYQFDGEFSSLEENAQLTLYRVIQECLTNISRHSKAKQAWIILKEEKRAIHLTVSDNGKGFEPSQHTQRFGLAGMKERLDSVGGTFDITSNLNQGVTIDVTVPKQGDNA
jgi:two-component system sensor histidine kinase UhpB